MPRPQIEPRPPSAARLILIDGNDAAGGTLLLSVREFVLNIPLKARLVRTLLAMSDALDADRLRPDVPDAFQGLLAHHDIAERLGAEPDGYTPDKHAVRAYLSLIRRSIRAESARFDIAAPDLFTRGDRAGVRLLVPLQVTRLSPRR